MSYIFSISGGIGISSAITNGFASANAVRPVIEVPKTDIQIEF